MKTKVLLAVFTILFAVNFQSFGQKKNEKQKAVFDVSMTCENCQKRIEKNIAFEKGITDMKVDLSAKTVMVEFQANKTDTTKIIKAFEKLGYEASVHNQ